jgi:glycosyltransferase involved in cell wall biosynthesis
MQITYFNRKSGINYSIERVFKTVKESLSHIINVDDIEMDYNRVRPRDILFNLYKAYNHRGKINHIVGDIHYVALVLPRKNTILTIHDISDIQNSNNFKTYFQWFFWFYLPARRVRYITCISQKTKEEVIKITKCDPNKIFLIHNPVDSTFIRTNKDFNSIYPRILHIGTTKNKNLERVIQALFEINCHLRIIGKLSIEQIDLLKKFNINYSNSYNLSNEEIIKEYTDSDIISFPSLNEGFGMPIIEGQSIGRIVLTSKITPMTEVANDSVHYVNPYDVNDIKNGFELLINNVEYRLDLIKKGFVNVKRFSSTNIALEYFSIYEKM